MPRIASLSSCFASQRDPASLPASSRADGKSVSPPPSPVLDKSFESKCRQRLGFLIGSADSMLARKGGKGGQVALLGALRIAFDDVRHVSESNASAVHHCARLLGQVAGARSDACTLLRQALEAVLQDPDDPEDQVDELTWTTAQKLFQVEQAAALEAVS